MTNNPATKYFATGIAAVVLTFGAYMIGRSNTGAGAKTSTSAAQRFAAPPGQSQSGQAPQGGQAPPGFGSPVTGTTLARLKAAVTASYPGQVERAMKLPDGTYVVHVIGARGETHIHLSKDFKIAGTTQGGAQQAPASGSSSATTS